MGAGRTAEEEGEGFYLLIRNNYQDRRKPVGLSPFEAVPGSPVLGFLTSTLDQDSLFTLLY